jgi:(4-O-methyl)-D-glucuronate---lignin esterase
VFAYRAPDSAAGQSALKPGIYGSGSLTSPTSPVTTNGSDGVALDADKLSDDSVTDPVYLPATSAANPTWVRFAYDRPITVNGISIAAGGSFSGWNDIVETGPLAQVYSSGNGKDWELLAEGIYSGVQRTNVVPATTARHFKVVFLPDPATASAAPLAIARLVLRTTPTIQQFEVKAGFGQTANYYAVDTPPLGSLRAVSRGEVVDITGKTDRDGVLRWKAP